MKEWIKYIGGLLLAAAIPIAVSILIIKEVNAQTYPIPTNFLVDQANVLSQEVEDSLNQSLQALRDSGKGEMGILTLDNIDPLTIEEYGIELAERWKVGNPEIDNGIILILAVENRKVRLEIGQGMEGTITDGEAGRILDQYAIPYLKNNDWELGIVSTTNAILARLESTEVVSHPRSVNDETGVGLLTFMLMIAVFGVFFISTSEY